MKNEKEELSRLGPVMSARLEGPAHEAGDCPDNEAIAALADGSIHGQERDRLMKHIASCHECYDVYTLTRQLISQETSTQKKRRHQTIFKPLALAASLLIVVFSIYTLWQRGDLPKKSADFVEMEEQISSAPVLESAPAPEAPGMKKLQPLDKIDSTESNVKGKKKEAKKDRVTQPARSMKPRTEGLKEKRERTEADTVSEPVVSEEEAPQVEPKVEAPGKANLKKRKMMKAKTPVKKSSAATHDRAGQREQFMDDGMHVAEHTRAPKPGMIFNQTPTAGKGIEQKIVVTGKLPAIARLNQINYIAIKADGYLPAPQLRSLFRESLTLAAQLSRDPSNAERQLQPLLKAVKTDNQLHIYPDIEYFLTRTAPDTPENRFFQLARSGWCDSQGNCYSKSTPVATFRKTQPSLQESRYRTGLQKKEKEKGVLKQWQEILPQLKGIFKEIAERTIRHIENP